MGNYGWYIWAPLILIVPLCFNWIALRIMESRKTQRERPTKRGFLAQIKILVIVQFGALFLQETIYLVNNIVLAVLCQNSLTYDMSAAFITLTVLLSTTVSVVHTELMRRTYKLAFVMPADYHRAILDGTCGATVLVMCRHAVWHTFLEYLLVSWTDFQHGIMAAVIQFSSEFAWYGMVFWALVRTGKFLIKSEMLQHYLRKTVAPLDKPTTKKAKSGTLMNKMLLRSTPSI